MQLLSAFVICTFLMVDASTLRPLLVQRRTEDADNKTFANVIAEDGLDLPTTTDPANSTDFNVTDFNATDFITSESTNATGNDEIPLNTTNTTNVTSTLFSDVPSLTPTITFNPTQPNNATNSSLSPTTASSTLVHSPTLSPVQSTPAPTYGLLPIQPINILVLTDVHSWVQGHGRHEPTLNADYGDVLSFYQRLKMQTESTKLSDGTTPDLYFVMNGDFVHGSILGEDLTSLSGIIERMPYDVVTVGNHDIKYANIVEELMKAGGLVDLWGERLVTSNVRVKKSSSDGTDSGELEPLGNNYRFLQGNQGTILVLGFLYNLQDPASATVETVQDVIKESWFTALFDSPRPTDFDVILVMAHMNVDDELITLLHLELRKHVGTTMVIQFITGHTHQRSYVELDEYSTSFEAGRYLDTIGFVSFDVERGNFDHVFVDANKASIAQSLGMSSDEYATQDGKDLADYIQRTFEHAGANQILGCSPLHYRSKGYLNETDSLLRLYVEEVMPHSFLQKYSSGNHYTKLDNVLVQRLDWFVKYDIFPGVVTLNDLIGVVPEDFTIVSVSNSIRGKDIIDIMEAWSNNETFLDNTTNVVGVSMPHSGDKIDSETKYALYTLSEYESTLNKIMINDLEVESFSSSHVAYNGDKTMRSLWADFIRKTWPYDGNNCGCMLNNTCGKLSDSSFGDSSSSWPWESPTSNTSSHASTHISLPSPPNPTSPEGNERQHQSHSTSNNNSESKSNSSGAFIFIAVALAAIFYTLRSRRQGLYSEAREVTRSHDLELRVTPPPGHGSVVPPAGYGNMNPSSSYSSPQLSRGSYV
ncbi:hypothetical protein ACHAXN_010492 [Cyclotella atomus]